ncbi:MAG: SpoIIE family protein phosphatase [Magnetococcus sp. YQC-5]
MMQEKKRVLIVDDERYNINLLINLLRADYEIIVAKSGELALKRVRSETPPDLILLDVMMPEMDGYEVCRQIKADEKTREIPVIFVTAMGGVDDENKGFDLGAVDYITKPISPSIVKARVKTHMALRHAFRQLEAMNVRLCYEREVMEYVVSRMGRSPHFDASHLRMVSSPLETVSGDILLSAFGPSACQHILLGDFTGHGLTAAIGGPIVADIFYSRTLMGYSMERIVAEINQALCDKLPDQMFMVGCFLEVNQSRNLVTVWNCALPDVLLFRDGHLHERIPSGFMARGLFVRTEKPAVQLSVRAGDLFFVYTDGILEETNQDNMIFGNDRIQETIQAIVSSGKPLESMLDELECFRSGRKQADDITLIELMC